MDHVAIEKTKSAFLIQIGERYTRLSFHCSFAKPTGMSTHTHAAYLHTYEHTHSHKYILNVLSNDGVVAVSITDGEWHVQLLRMMLMFWCLDIHSVSKFCMREGWVWWKGKVRIIEYTIYSHFSSSGSYDVCFPESILNYSWKSSKADLFYR